MSHMPAAQQLRLLHIRRDGPAEALPGECCLPPPPPPRAAILGRHVGAATASARWGHAHRRSSRSHTAGSSHGGRWARRKPSAGGKGRG